MTVRTINHKTTS